MSFKVDKITPIILSLVLPSVRFYSFQGQPTSDYNSVLITWIFSSLTIFFLWWSLWSLWEIKNNRKKWLSPLLFIITVLFMVINNNYFFSDNILVVVRIFPVLFLLITIQYNIRLQQNKSILLLEKEQLYSENLKTQLKLLRTKIDPHFLFNSLNTLQSMIHNENPNSNEYLVSLSNFYRQTLIQNENLTIPVSQELKVLRDYLYLMQCRNENSVKIHIDIDESLYTNHIPPMTLQIIVENCFKHNSMTSKNPLNIYVTNKNDSSINVCNNIQPKIEEKETTGMGMELIRKRYELLGIKQGLEVENKHHRFCVKLKTLQT